MKKESDKMKIGGIILSGGKSRRMKSDKSLKKINDRPLLEIVLEKSMKQLDYIFINSNNFENYNFKGTDIDVVKDCIKGYLGPLAGILTGMKWLKKKNNNFTHLMSFPIDSPFFPNNLVSKFLNFTTLVFFFLVNSSIFLVPFFIQISKSSSSLRCHNENTG